ncbi:MAG TPA: gamma-glutamyl-gamma-aminobutyrate hydrolase family protein [Rhizomicrobium sp.]|nr:gamma-glutamyl-gamma-aminobutyrate hydrolase family protein [Rhizomicrobium sp.]
MSGRRPVVGIACDFRVIGMHPFHAVGEKYIVAVRDGAQTLPLLIPVLDPPIPPDEILSSVDGLFFTGSPSNVSPALYSGAPPREGTWLDERRDATALPLLMSAIEKGVPVFAVCRGFQELNVALGGSLHQHVHEIEGRFDHREDKHAELDVQYGPVHDVRVGEGGLLSRLLPEKSFRVNSLHSQGIDRLAPPLVAEATAPDGTIEAVSMPSARGFLLGTQWHPEWKWHDNPVSRALFAAFGAAVRERAGI